MWRQRLPHRGNDDVRIWPFRRDRCPGIAPHFLQGGQVGDPSLAPPSPPFLRRDADGDSRGFDDDGVVVDLRVVVGHAPAVAIVELPFRENEKHIVVPQVRVVHTTRFVENATGIKFAAEIDKSFVVPIALNPSAFELLRPPVNHHVLVVLPKQRTVIVVDLFRTAVVRDQKVPEHVPERHNRRGLPGPHGGQKRLSVPAVNRAVVAALAAGVEEDVCRNDVATPEAVVEIEPSPGEIEDHVPTQRRLRGLGLKKRG